jgi:hypothetical protein
MQRCAEEFNSGVKELIEQGTPYANIKIDMQFEKE